MRDFVLAKNAVAVKIILQDFLADLMVLYDCDVVDVIGNVGKEVQLPGIISERPLVSCHADTDIVGHVSLGHE